MTTDKGFNSEKNNKELLKKNIYNCICPKKIKELEKRLKEIEFIKLQKRRAQTEGRISILKNLFLGERFRSKGFKNREKMVACKIFTHNLWVIARLAKIKIQDDYTCKAA
jgi:Transposase DDE domain.